MTVKAELNEFVEGSHHLGWNPLRGRITEAGIKPKTLQVAQDDIGYFDWVKVWMSAVVVESCGP